jgi:isocitrate dehydrogenase
LAKNAPEINLIENQDPTKQNKKIDNSINKFKKHHYNLRMKKITPLKNLKRDINQENKKFKIKNSLNSLKSLKSLQKSKRIFNKPNKIYMISIFRRNMEDCLISKLKKNLKNLKRVVSIKFRLLKILISKIFYFVTD